MWYFQILRVPTKIIIDVNTDNQQKNIFRDVINDWTRHLENCGFSIFIEHKNFNITIVVFLRQFLMAGTFFCKYWYNAFYLSLNSLFCLKSGKYKYTNGNCEILFYLLPPSPYSLTYDEVVYVHVHSRGFEVELMHNIPFS